MALLRLGTQFLTCTISLSLTAAHRRRECCVRHHARGMDAAPRAGPELGLALRPWRARPRVRFAHSRMLPAPVATPHCSTCQAKGCSNRGSATAHVQKTDGRSSREWHLTWVCASHNHTSHSDPYALRKNAMLLPVSELRK